MATWITHLRIAEKLLARIPALDPGAFAVGNIAPDSGIPDDEVHAHYIERPDRYLSQEEMDRFVDETTEKLFRIYSRLFGAAADLAGRVSALELL